MKYYNKHIWPINQLFISLASLSILTLVLRYSSEIIAPFLIAMSITILLSPTFNYLETKRIPKVISLMFITVLVLIPMVLLGGYLSQEVQEFAQNYHKIQQRFDEWIENFSIFLGGIGLQISQGDINAALEKANFAEIIQNLLLQTKNQFSNIFLIFFLVAFMLMESTYFYNKLVKIMNDRDRDIENWMEIIKKVKSYFLIKMKSSLLTGVWALLVLLFYDIQYAILWATLTFFLNFIPVIGSILSAIPPVLVALVDHSLMTGLWVAIWYIIINTIIGNILEPHIMGEGLGLSALVIFISMTFWGWVFGPAGMILSVPLTMVLQFLFDQYEETKWAAFILSDYKKD